jgi:hypothetical protein
MIVGLPGMMPRQELRDQPAVDVVAAARPVADQHAQGLAAIEIRDRLRVRRRGRQQERSRGNPERNLPFLLCASSLILSVLTIFR